MPLRAAFTSPDSTDAMGRQLATQIREIAGAAPNLNGPLWNNAMEVAIRAMNWTAADDLLGGAIARAYGDRDWTELIHLHGRVIWARLEARLRSSNHYLANLLGLSWLARHFDEDPDAAHWQKFADREFGVALRAQCYADGGAYEASLPYHALITEMALLHLALQDTPSQTDRHHIERMLAIVAAARRADGSLFPIGDDDSGRIFAVDRTTPGLGYADALIALGRLVLSRAIEVPDTLMLPETGWYFQRISDWQLAIHFGGTGFAGQGSHAHNDVFSFCLDWHGLPVFIDPGSYLYSGDPAERNRFRSARAHNVFAPDGQDPYPISDELQMLFALRGPARAYATRTDERRLHMSGAPFGFPYARTIEWSGSGWVIQDEYRSKSDVVPTWFFQIGADFKVEREGESAVRLIGPVGRLILRADFSCQIEILEGEWAPRFGRRASCARIRAVAPPARAAALSWRITPA